MSAASRHELLDGLRSLSRPRVRACRRKRISPTVQVQRRPDGGTSRCGVLSCGSVWACPVCASRIYQGRTEELKKAMRGWQGQTLLLTATVRHGMGDDLKQLRGAESKAWRSLWAGKAGMRRRRQWGLKHTVRGLEVTYGSNGWHPHLHVLAFVTNQVTDAMVTELREAWVRAVVKHLGAAHAPTFERGLDVRPTSCAEYLAKLGLEVANIEAKSGRSGARTPWQIAKDAAAGDGASRALWRAYCRDMLGARQLCWSKGAKRALGIVERSDDELAEEALGVGHVLAEWRGVDWDACMRAFPMWSSMVERAAEHAHSVDELNRLPLAKAQSPPGVITAYRLRETS